MHGKCTISCDTRMSDFYEVDHSIIPGIDFVLSSDPYFVKAESFEMFWGCRDSRSPSVKNASSSVNSSQRRFWLRDLRSKHEVSIPFEPGSMNISACVRWSPEHQGTFFYNWASSLPHQPKSRPNRHFLHFWICRATKGTSRAKRSLPDGH